MPSSIFWTLQNECPIPWQNKFTKLNYSLSYHPLITLAVNDNIHKIAKIVSDYEALIVSSQFSAIFVVSLLKNKYQFYTVGTQASSHLKEAGHEILYTAENSEDLAHRLQTQTDLKILHLCSEKSNTDIWPSNVNMLPFYEPKENLDFNLTADKFDSDSIIVFGSPSGVDIWFIKNIDLSNTTIATMGKTTARRFTTYTNHPLIIPQSSTIDHLCEAIYKHLKSK